MRERLAKSGVTISEYVAIISYYIQTTCILFYLNFERRIDFTNHGTQMVGLDLSDQTVFAYFYSI
jgi:hypothetical protein